MTIPWLFEGAGAPNARVAVTPAIVPPVIARKERRLNRDIMSSGPCQRPCRRGLRPRLYSAHQQNVMHCETRRRRRLPQAFSILSTTSRVVERPASTIEGYRGGA